MKELFLEFELSFEAGWRQPQAVGGLGGGGEVQPLGQGRGSGLRKLGDF